LTRRAAHVDFAGMPKFLCALLFALAAGCTTNDREYTRDHLVLRPARHPLPASGLLPRPLPGNPFSTNGNAFQE